MDSLLEVEKRGARLHALLIDPYAGSREGLRASLEAEGCLVEATADAPHALALMRAGGACGAGCCPPTNFTCSWPFRTAGVMAQVPPQPAAATRPAVSAPAKGKVKPLVMPPRIQKVALKGA